MPPPPRAGGRVYPDDIVAAINQQFDPAAKRVVTYYEDAANNEIYLDTGRLASLGFGLKDVAKFLAGLPHFAAVFTEDEIRAAQSRLPRR
jgi:hypothetical protein